MTVTILQGDAIAILPTLPAKSIHCVVTSPPYWGLRDYGVQQSVWGGDPDCKHRFGRAEFRNMRGIVGERSTIDGDQSRSGNRLKQINNGSFCRCGAWRGCFGLEPTPELYIEHAVAIFREVRRVLRDDGTLWLNIGDCYATSGGPGVQGKHGATADRVACQTGVRERRYAKRSACKPKDLVGIPWMLAFALRADGWFLRSEIVWHKPNPMPESVVDRPTRAHEQVFLFAKSRKYFYDQSTVCSPSGANALSVWKIPTYAFPEAHFATFPPRLAETCIKGGTPLAGCCPSCGASLKGRVSACNCNAGDPVPCTVLDPFGGAGTTGLVADRIGRNAILIELNPDYAEMARRRITEDAGIFADVV